MIRLSTLTIAILLTISLLCGIAEADDATGQGYYGMLSQRWPCKAMRQSEKKLTVLRRAVLWRTFGNKQDCLKKDMADPRLKFLEIHLINQTCQTNKRCALNEILFGYDLAKTKKQLENPDSKLSKAIRAEAATVAAFLNANLRPQTECAISPFLESTLDTQSAEKAFQLVKPFFPRCKMVWSPRAGNNSPRPPSAQIVEKHGERPNMQAPCIGNLDGVDIALPGRPAVLPQSISAAEARFYLSKYSYCVAAFLWIAEYNGIHREGFKTPLIRTNWPTLKTFEAINGIGKAAPQIEPPRPFNDADKLSLAGCSKIEQSNDGSGGFVYKPESETRPNTYVVIFPAKFVNRFSQVWIESQGKKFESLSFSAFANPDSHGPRQHWRSAKSSAAMKINSVLKTNIGSCWKLPDPHFRID